MLRNKLTKFEWAGLTEGSNLADGHAHQPQNKSIVKDMSKLYVQAEAGNQNDIQAEFERVFFTLNGQKSYKQLPPPLYQPACSFSIEALANYLREQKLSVALLHPCFDNLADILKRHHIKLQVIEEGQLINPLKGLSTVTADVIFLVLPNNPTGFEPNRRQFLEIIEYCRINKKLLVLDHSFRFYSNYTTWDQYKYLLKSGIDFVVFEDTGKTWPTLELKLGITLCSRSLFEPLKDITNDFLLNVSPFTFTLMTEYVKREGTEEAISNVTANRTYVKLRLQNTALKIYNEKNNLSVEWLQLPKEWSATKLTEWLHQHDVHILPGMPFFWDDPEQGESFIRIALQRPAEKLIPAVNILTQAIKEYEKLMLEKT